MGSRHYLKQQAEVVQIRLGSKSRCFTLYEAFGIFNTSKNGLLRLGELWAGMKYLGLMVSFVPACESFFFAVRFLFLNSSTQLIVHLDLLL